MDKEEKNKGKNKITIAHTCNRYFLLIRPIFYFFLLKRQENLKELKTKSLY